MVNNCKKKSCKNNKKKLPIKIKMLPIIPGDPSLSNKLISKSLLKRKKV